MTSGTPDVDVRKAILSAAVELIEANGLADVSMREVARRAGVSHQLPYHYFTDRERILAAIAEEGFEILDGRLDAAAKKKVSGAEKLANAGRAYVDFACEHRAHFRVMFRQDFVDLGRHPDAQANAGACFKHIPVIVEQMVGEGLDSTVDAHALAIMSWSVAHGLACILLDGPLVAAKLPEAATAREATTRRVMETLRHLVESASKRRRK